MPLNVRESDWALSAKLKMYSNETMSRMLFSCRCCRYVAPRPLWEFKLENFNIEMAYIGEWRSPFISSETWAIRSDNIINLSFSSRSGLTKSGEHTADARRVAGASILMIYSYILKFGLIFSLARQYAIDIAWAYGSVFSSRWLGWATVGEPFQWRYEIISEFIV